MIVACCRFMLGLMFISSLTWGVVLARSVEFETTRVTEADVTISPDEQWLVFTMLGHLFRVPAEGGIAEQLTFGPWYDTEPAYSPDGSYVAFGSDRDKSEGNIFVVETATGQINQVTHEFWAGRPVWTPDGHSIVYLASDAGQSKKEVRRVAQNGGKPEIVSASPGTVGSLFYLNDGRLAWTVVKRKKEFPDWETKIVVVDSLGADSVLYTLDGREKSVVASPTGDGLYCRITREAAALKEDLIFISTDKSAQKIGTVLSIGQNRCFAVSADASKLYVGDAGRLWEIALPGGIRQPVPFHAHVKLEIHDRILPEESQVVGEKTDGNSSLMGCRLSPDGSRLVFEAAGHLWQQLPGGKQAERLFDGSGVEESPAFSPDGRQLAFVYSKHSKDEIRIFDFENGKTRTLVHGQLMGSPSWSREGKQLIYVKSGVYSSSVVALNLSDGKEQTLTNTGMWSSNPHLSANRKSLYYSANTTGLGALYRLALEENAEPELVTQLARHLSDGLVSADEKWLAFRRNAEIWIAPLGTEPVTEEQVRLLNVAGGKTFSFTPDGLAVVYIDGNRVWRHPIDGGEREEILVRLKLERPSPPPVLIRGVRILDFTLGGFGSKTSLLIDRGQIQWIGAEDGQTIPNETITIETEGRFAIPGLFDFHVHSGGVTKLRS